MRAISLLFLFLICTPRSAAAEVFRWTRDTSSSTIATVDNRPQLVLTAGDGRVSLVMRYLQISLRHGILPLIRADVSIENLATARLKVKPHEIRLTRTVPPLGREVNQYDPRTVRIVMEGMSFARVGTTGSDLRDRVQAATVADQLLKDALEMKDLIEGQFISGSVFFGVPSGGTPGRVGFDLEVLINGNSYQFPFEMDLPDIDALR